MRLFRAACAIALAFIALACTGVRAADSFPSRPIEIVVTAAAGGGNLAGALVARAAPDGHILFLAND